eukprot:Clim_evm52s150 gene=Clim_evmTU52s150
MRIQVYQWLLALLLAGSVAGHVQVSPTRYLYKNSFRTPHIVDKATQKNPHWSFLGDVRVTPFILFLVQSKPMSSGLAQSMNPFRYEYFQIDVQFRVRGKSSDGAGGIAIWLTDEPQGLGNLFGGREEYSGMGVFIDTFNDEDRADTPRIATVLNEESRELDPNSDLADVWNGFCGKVPIRNTQEKATVRISYTPDKEFVVQYTDSARKDDFHLCHKLRDVDFKPENKFFAISAQNKQYVDSTEVFSFMVTALKTEDDIEAEQMNQDSVVHDHDGGEAEILNEYEASSEQMKKDFGGKSATAASGDGQSLEMREVEAKLQVVEDFVSEELDDHEVRLKAIEGLMDTIVMHGKGGGGHDDDNGGSGTRSVDTANLVKHDSFRELQKQVNRMETKIQNQGTRAGGSAPPDDSELKELRDEIASLNKEVTSLKRSVNDQKKQLSGVQMANDRLHNRLAGNASTESDSSLLYLVLFGLLILAVGFAIYVIRERQRRKEHLL